jgi:hypothetical protein
MPIKTRSMGCSVVLKKLFPQQAGVISIVLVATRFRHNSSQNGRFRSRRTRTRSVKTQAGARAPNFKKMRHIVQNRRSKLKTKSEEKRQKQTTDNTSDTSTMAKTRESSERCTPLISRGHQAHDAEEESMVVLIDQGQGDFSPHIDRITNLMNERILPCLGLLFRLTATTLVPVVIIMTGCTLSIGAPPSLLSVRQDVDHLRISLLFSAINVMLDALLVAPLSEAAMIYTIATSYFDRLPSTATTTNALLLSHTSFQKMRVLVLLSAAAHSFCLVYYWFLCVLLAPMLGRIDAGHALTLLVLWLLFLPGMIPLFGCFFLAIPVAVLEKSQHSCTDVMQRSWQLRKSCCLCGSSFQIVGLMLFMANHTFLFYVYPFLYESLTEVDFVINQVFWRLALGLVYVPCMAAIKTFAYLKWRRAADGSLDELRQDMVKDEDACTSSDDDQNEMA